MEENQQSTFSASLMPGVLLGLALIVFSLILFLIGVDTQSKANWISYLIMAGGLFWAMQTYRDKHLGGFATYGQVFGAGFWTGFIATIIAAVFTYFYVSMINPGILDEIILNAEEEILNSGNQMSDEQLEQALSFTEKFVANPLAMTIWAFVANVILTLILSLIIAIFVKREDKSLA